MSSRDGWIKFKIVARLPELKCNDHNIQKRHTMLVVPWNLLTQLRGNGFSYGNILGLIFRSHLGKHACLVEDNTVMDHSILTMLMVALGNNCNLIVFVGNAEWRN